MSWLGEGLANLKGQISSFTREVLTDDNVEENSHEDGFLESVDAQNLRKRTREFEELSAQQGTEIHMLKSQILEREEAYGRQIKSTRDSYQTLLDNKDEENQRIREQLGALEAALKQLESEKNANQLQLPSDEESYPRIGEEEKGLPVEVCETETNTERNEYDEFYVQELDERCSSYQNELFLMRNELMSLQHHTDQLEERGAKLGEEFIQIFQSDFLLDGQPVLPISKLKRGLNAGETGLLLEGLKQLASVWKDLVERKGLLERTVAKLSQTKHSPDDGEDENAFQSRTASIPISNSPSHPTNAQVADAFMPSKIDSFGLETILEEDRNDDESRSESGYINPGDDTSGAAGLHRTLMPNLSPTALITTLTASTSCQTELSNEGEHQEESSFAQLGVKAEITALSLQVSQLLNREQELLTIIDEKENQISRLEMELTRLRTHLVETEDQFTNETLASEGKIKQLENEFSQLMKEYSQALQDKEPSEYLRDEILRLTEERKEAWAQSSSLQDQVQKLTTQLQNLHFVLEQFQKEKEVEIAGIERRCRSDKDQLEQKNNMLRKELEKQESLLEKAKFGLDAAQQLNAQIEERARAISSLKAQVQERDGELSKLKSQMEEVAKNLDGKIDRYLVKNLVVGYFSTPSDKRKEVLRVLATVLDFNREDRQKTNLESASIWPFSRSESSASSGQEKQSLSEAFIHFLESESQPKVELRIPAEEMTRRNSRSSGSSSSSTVPATSSSPPPFPGLSPSLPNPAYTPGIPSDMSMSIPGLSQVDHSNSILKDVLNPKP